MIITRTGNQVIPSTVAMEKESFTRTKTRRRGWHSNGNAANENKNTVKIISETGSEVGEITLKIIPAKKTPVKGSTFRKLLKLKHNDNDKK